jgi:hypothetical protein
LDQDRLGVQDAWTQLQVVLGLFPRVDTMVASILAVNVAMVGFAFSRWPEDPSYVTPLMVICVIAYALFASLVFYSLYRCIFPVDDPQGKSIVFFGCIASKDVAKDYVDEFASLTAVDLRDAILQQVWRNSSILVVKYRRIKASLRWLLTAVFAWVIFLLAS